MKEKKSKKSDKIKTPRSKAASRPSRAARRKKAASAAAKPKGLASILELVLDKTEAVVFVKDRDGRFIYISPQYEKRLGMPRGSLIGKTNYDVFPREMADKLRANDAVVLKAGKAMEFEEVGRQSDGVDHVFISLKFPIEEIPGAICGISTDITERKRTEEALKESRYFLDASQRIARLGSYALDVKSGLWTSTEILDEIFGIGAGVRKDVDAWARLLHPDDRDKMLAYFKEHVLAGRNDFDKEYRIVRQNDGVVRWVHGLGKVTYGPDAEPERMIGTIQDVTERKVVEETLKESRYFLDASQRIARLGSFVLDVKSGKATTTAILDEIFGVDTDVGKDLDVWADRIHPDERAAVVAYLQEHVLAGRNDFDKEYRIVRQNDGAVRWVHGLGKVSHGPGGEPVRMIGTIQDVTERKAIEEELRRAHEGLERKVAERTRELTKTMDSLSASEEKYRTLIEEMSEAIFTSTPDGRLIDCNRAGAALFGYDSVEEMKGVSTSSFYYDPRDRETFRREMAANGFVKDFEIIARKKGGERIYILMTADAVRDDDGRVLMYMGLVRDVTRQRELQEQLLQAQKMEAIGALSGGIAHDFNNILAVMKSFTTLAIKNTEPGSPIREYLDPMRETINRGVNLVQQLLIYSRKKSFTPAVLDLNDAVEGMLGMLKAIIGEGVSITSALEPDLRRIKADRTQIEQVIANLVINGSDAMPEGGSIVVATRNRTVTAKEASRTYGAASGEYVCLKVEDNGVGIPKETIGRIFEPFFTTKKAMHSGMGLAVVYGIVKESGGWISVSSSPGKGASFEVFLPAHSGAKPDDASDRTVKPEKGGGERILVVEDDELVRRSTRMMLIEYGYEVAEAAGAAEAAAMVERGERFDLVLSDVAMPGEDGFQMARDLRAQNPGTPIILFSGHLDDKAKIDDIRKSGIPFLQKPFEMADLLTAVREAIKGG